MSPKTRQELFAELYERYHQAAKVLKTQILNECCATTRLHRKSAIRKLNGPPPDAQAMPTPRGRARIYAREVVAVAENVWDTAGYPCGVRLKAVLQRWRPWIERRFPLSPAQTEQLFAISARQLDRRLAEKKRLLKKRRYGRTKPGTLLKHHIPIKTDHWDVTTPGFHELDTVAHCGNSAEGEYAHTVNQTDIFTGWVESRAVLGKSAVAVVTALDEMRAACPFPTHGYDSDNGSEFLNYHLLRYCQAHAIQPWRSRPYKKDDNAHIEQKNWTHVRKIIGYDRYETSGAVAAINALYRQDLRLFMNLFLPAMKLVTKERVGAKLRRRYDVPQTPLDRVIASKAGDPRKVAALLKCRETLDPFTLAATIDQALQQIWRLAHPAPPPKAPAPWTREPETALTRLSGAVLARGAEGPRQPVLTGGASR